ncbi:DUF397 domain-containing protein [Nocardia asteroides]|uniref:DUF397 domain-containing protein n=1 Tax=Nocardia asteroides TaxID=1824 RepID=UPI001E471B48|nr:DUF397 domain-containing protein [Nocardia asteroides]UGT59635.1 DUF397 domain-containing protein [Nocardia asteroides]
MEHDLPELTFHKSTFSQAGGECVEVAEAPNGDRYVRDSKNPAAGTLRFTAGAWTAFTHGVRSGEF